MMRALAYCAFQSGGGFTFPAVGVQGAPVEEMVEGRLRVLWSEVDWPFKPDAMQKNAIEFHHVISQVFEHAAVAPFPLLSIFDDRQSLLAFVAGRARHFIADLERLKDLVQMECVLYLIGERPATGAGLNTDSLEQRKELLNAIHLSAERVRNALARISPEVRIRDVKSGSRLFALVKRGAEAEFLAIAESILLPEQISRRTSGPRPATEFLCAAVKERRIETGT